MIADMHVLFDVRVCSEFSAPDGEQNWRCEEVVSQFPHFFRPRGGPHQRVTVALHPKRQCYKTRRLDISTVDMVKLDTDLTQYKYKNVNYNDDYTFFTSS